MTLTGVIGVILFFILGTTLLTACSSGLNQLRRRSARSELKSARKLFWITPLQEKLLPKGGTTLLLFHLIFAQNLYRFVYTASALYFAFSLTPTSWPLALGALFLFFGASLALSDLAPRLIANRHPQKALYFIARFASLFLLLSFPLAYPFLRIFYGFSHTPSVGLPQIKNKILDILEDADTHIALDSTEKKLIMAALTFRDRIVREVMVPRIDVFGLSEETSIQDAANQLKQEGYSRIPIYKETVDQITGILMFRELLDVYMRADPSLLEQPISTIMRPVFFAPETRRISDLLHDFRNRKAHIAVVVDEYGATEGIVTIEDILEEIVGEISDEYDEEEVLFTPSPGGGWVVDGRMPILDVEEQLGFTIPQDSDYDTVAGYLFHRAGEIPKKGFRIHHDTFDIEVVKSSDRLVQKVKISSSASTSDTYST